MVPRREYPRPSLRRHEWVNLNGEWEFGAGPEPRFDRRILVPYCPQSPLSGIGERVVNHVAAKDRDIAMVFQSYALYPHMTVYDNLAFPLQMKRMPKAEIDRRVRQASRILGLDNFLNLKPRALSGGQRQRVALGRAIVRSPQVFLLDEPLSNLDAKLRAQTRIELQKLHRELETTFIYVTHDQVEAMTMGDRIAIMYDGILQQVGTPDEIYDHPANLFVAGFIGSPTMNFVPVTLQNGTAKASGFEVSLQKSVAPATGTLGFRPEAVTDRVQDGASLNIKVDVVERLGSDQFLYGQVGSDTITARVDPRMKVTPGDTVRLGLDTRSLHLFDPETEKALL